jgi:hypothetical protein
VLAGLTDKLTSAGGVTCNVADPEIAPETAVMLVVPWPTLTARPPLAIVATDVADDAQVTDVVKFCVVPLLYVPMAVNCWLVPCAIDAGVGVTAIETSTEAIPMPVSETVCGLLFALSLTVRVPVRFPVIVGAKLMATVQLELAASEAGARGQVVVSWKSLKLLVMLLIVNAVV